MRKFVFLVSNLVLAVTLLACSSSPENSTTPGGAAVIPTDNGKRTDPTCQGESECKNFVAGDTDCNIDGKPAVVDTALAPKKLAICPSKKGSIVWGFEYKGGKRRTFKFPGAAPMDTIRQTGFGCVRDLNPPNNFTMVKYEKNCGISSSCTYTYQREDLAYNLTLKRVMTVKGKDSVKTCHIRLKLREKKAK